MKKIIFFMFLFFVPFFLFPQTEKETVFLLFDGESKELCNIPKSEQGRYHTNKTDMFSRIKTKKGVNFYICNELFVFDKSSKLGTCSIDSLKKINFSSFWDLKKIVNEINPFYPSEVFNKIYLIEYKNTRAIIYDTKWKYYIE